MLISYANRRVLELLGMDWDNLQNFPRTSPQQPPNREDTEKHSTRSASATTFRALRHTHRQLRVSLLDTRTTIWNLVTPDGQCKRHS